MSLTTAFLSLMLALQNPVQAPPTKPAPDKVLATVNGVPIKASDIEPYLWDWKAGEVLRDLIDAKLIQAEAATKKITLTDAEVSGMIKARLDSYQASLPKGKTLEQAFQEQGLTMSRVTMGLRQQMLIDKIIASNFHPQDYVNISSIIFPIKSAAASDLSAALKRAETAYAALKKGDSWEKVLRLNEQNETVLASKGLIGWVTYAAFPKVAEDEIRTLHANGYSKPVQTNQGIQLFKINIQGKEGSPTDIAELRSRFVAAERPRFIEKLRANAKIEKP